MSYQHNCIKCATAYTSKDDDPYYCEKCDTERKAIATDIDKKLAGSARRETKSELQIFDEIRKSKGVRFVNIRDLGIKL